MRISKVFLILFVACVKQQARCHSTDNSGKLLITQDSKLPKLICDAVRDAFSKDRQISTVSMAIFKNNIESPLVDETLKCIPKRLSVNVKDLELFRMSHNFDGHWWKIWWKIWKYRGGIVKNFAEYQEQLDRGYLTVFRKYADSIEFLSLMFQF